MSIDAMKQALEALELLARYENPETKIQVRKPRDGGSIVTMYPHKVASEAATALRAAIEQAQDPETELETYKHLYELRGKALERPCSNCGHQPAKIKAMAQPNQEPVFELGFGWLDDATKYQSGTKLYATSPRQWQGLTSEDKVEILRANGEAAVLILTEAKLREKNT